jgi:hypothetical protein
MAGRYARGWSKQHQDVFKLSIQGMKLGEIVEKTGIPYDRVRTIMRSIKFQEHEVDIKAKGVEAARKLLEERVTEAAGKILKIMRQGKPDEKLQFDAAKEILYQCGMKPVEVVETRNREYTPEEIQSSLTVIKEVQAIEEQLSTQGSGFLLKRDDASSMSAPVTTDKKAPSDGKEVFTPTEETIATNV